ncbi:phosphonoacetaldehyde hydrolase [Companilactobacillus furfuricola]|uniref:phosphonoacetaldehyde hydrolase n=1 Tax=Companilactobacillus furfuricola TaxID=1462575 RepID=UPI000F79B916|nr:phosphonoacetaldehyde hydrolase [Companilactobacillus furfuricola]
MIEVVIFDWAGTTVDYGSLAPVEAFRAAFNTKKIYPSDSQIRQFMGMSKSDHIWKMLELPEIVQQFEEEYQHLPTEADHDELYDLFESALMAHLVKKTELKPYLLDAIDYLQQQDIKIATTTGYTPKMMEAVATGAAKLGYRPEMILTSADVENHGRPYPDMINKILTEFAISAPENAINIGDTIVDIEEGKNAKVKTIGIVEGSSLMGMTESEYQALSEEARIEACELVRQQFINAGADFIINNLSELPEVIKSLNQLKEM